MDNKAIKDKSIMSKSRKNIKTTHLAILEYWKDKEIDENGNIILSTKNTDRSIQVVKDWGEPVCWCCGDFLNEKYDWQPRSDYRDLYKLSEVKSHLNRCHIIPDSLGGEDRPENLFLLCELCHSEAPDVNDSRAFLKWIYDQRSYGGYFQRIAKESFEKSEVDLGSVDEEEFKKQCKKVLCSTHGGKLKESSIIYKTIICLKNSVKKYTENDVGQLEFNI